MRLPVFAPRVHRVSPAAAPTNWQSEPASQIRDDHAG